jgi:hypothetical protein
MLNPFRKLFEKKHEELPREARARQMLAEAKLSQSFVPLTSTVNRQEAVKEVGAVTGTYEMLTTAMTDAVNEKRKAKEAAQRVSDSIGTSGQRPTKK